LSVRGARSVQKRPARQSRTAPAKIVATVCGLDSQGPLRGDRVLARVAWWTDKEGGEPLALDFFDLDPELPADERAEIGLRLPETAAAAVVPAGAVRPEYGRFLPPDWHGAPGTRAPLETLLDVLERAGARPLVERLRLEWRPGTAA
jgi:hypothetical protein